MFGARAHILSFARAHMYINKNIIVTHKVLNFHPIFIFLKNYQ